MFFLTELEFGQELIKNFPTLYKEVTANLASRAHSTKLGVLDSDTTTFGSSSVQIEESMDVDDTSLKQNTIHNYMNLATISEKMRMHIELLMFRMFICCALPWALMDSPFFKDFVNGLNVAFHIPD